MSHERRVRLRYCHTTFLGNSLHGRDRSGENVHQRRKQARWAHEVTLSFELLYADVLSSHRSSLPRHNRRDCARSFAVMGLPTGIRQLTPRAPSAVGCLKPTLEAGICWVRQMIIDVLRQSFAATFWLACVENLVTERTGTVTQRHVVGS
jgi:hypothetical protein